MSKRPLIAAAGGMALLALAGAARADDAAVTRGAYIFAAADCVSCHTDKKHDGAPLAGGRALATDFGTFYSKNITPDKEHGIGDWSLEQFKRALREGIDDEGQYIYPVFPFASFTGMSDQDIADLYAYIMAQPPSDRRNTPHVLNFPFRYRWLLIGWRTLFFRAGPLQSDPSHDAEWNRGRYLAEAVVHCQECHTPRNFLGGLDRAQAYAGNPHGPDGQKTPNITPDAATGIGKWSLEDIATVLESGMTPDFDSVGDGMGEVVQGTAKLTDADRHAIAVYLKSLPPLHATAR